MGTVFILEEHLQSCFVYTQCIWQIFLFEAVYIDLFFQGYCVSLKEALPFFKGNELVRHSSCSHPFDGWSFFSYKRADAAKHSFKITVLFQNMSYSKEMS